MKILFGSTALAGSLVFGAFAGSVLAGQAEPLAKVAEQKSTAPDWSLCAGTTDSGVCSRLGEVYFGPSNTYSVKAQGVPFYIRACNLANNRDHARSCYIAGKAIALGILDFYSAVSPEYRVDPAKGRALFNRGCQLGDVESCGGLGDFQQRGIGGPIDQVAAMQSFNLGCTIDKTKFYRHTASQACHQLGLAALRATGTDVDYDAGVEILRYNCDPLQTVGDRFQGASCFELGKASEQGLYGRDINLTLSMSWYTDACRKASKEGCAKRDEARADPTKIAVVEGIDSNNASLAAAVAEANNQAKPDCNALATRGLAVMADYDRAADALMAGADKAMATTDDKNALRTLNMDFTRNVDVLSENACNALLDIRDEANLACNGTMRTEMMASSLRYAQTAAASISGEFNTNNVCRTRLRFAS